MLFIMYYRTIIGVNVVLLHWLDYYPITNLSRLYLPFRLLIRF